MTPSTATRSPRTASGTRPEPSSHADSPSRSTAARPGARQETSSRSASAYQPNAPSAGSSRRVPSTPTSTGPRRDNNEPRRRTAATPPQPIPSRTIPMTASATTEEPWRLPRERSGSTAVRADDVFTGASPTRSSAPGSSLPRSAASGAASQAATSVAPPSTSAAAAPGQPEDDPPSHRESACQSRSPAQNAAAAPGNAHVLIR